MPRSSTRLRAALVLCPILLLMLVGDADARRRRPIEPLQLKTWEVGFMGSSFVGPSHDDLLNQINRVMRIMQSEPGYKFDDFGATLPLSMRLTYNIEHPVSVALTYSYSPFETSMGFNPAGWWSDRKVTTKLHQIDATLQYGLSFIRSRRVMPYIGGGLCLAIADSRLDIDIQNVLGAGPEDPDTGEVIAPYPDRAWSLTTVDWSIGAVAVAGLVYHFTPRAAVVVEMMGIMSQVDQTFDFAGTLQYIQPNSEDALIEDPSTNDILEGNYPLSNNGLRVSLGLLFGI